MTFDSWEEENMFHKYAEAIHRCQHRLKGMDEDLALADSILGFLIKNAWEKSKGWVKGAPVG